MNTDQMKFLDILLEVKLLVKKLRDSQNNPCLSGQFRLGLEHTIALNIDATQELRNNSSPEFRILNAELIKNNLLSIQEFVQHEVSRKAKLERLVSLDPHSWMEQNYA